MISRVTGEFALDRSEQYRKNAANSLMLSREATTRASQDYWVTMAEFWFKLVRHAAGAAPVRPNRRFEIMGA